MTTITALGTATQICEWMGVPDPAIHHVMNLLHNAGLYTAVDGQQEKRAPQYSTIEAFEIYADKLGQSLPPEPARLLREAKLKRERDRACGIAPISAPGPISEEASQAPSSRPVRQRGSNTREQALAQAYARENGLVTKEDIGGRYNKLTSNGFLKESFRAKLANNGLKPHGKKIGRISVYHPVEVDEAAQKAGYTVPDEPWECLLQEPPTVTPGSETSDPRKPKVPLLSIAEFLDGKELDGEPIGPGDYQEIEMELNTLYQLRVSDGRDGVKLYIQRDLNSSWRRYVADSK